jgi:hypothetical protein
MWMPSIQKVVSYISKNMRWYERVDIGHDNLAVFKKLDQDSRPWDDFTDF